MSVIRCTGSNIKESAKTAFYVNNWPYSKALSEIRTNSSVATPARPHTTKTPHRHLPAFHCHTLKVWLSTWKRPGAQGLAGGTAPPHTWLPDLPVPVARLLLSGAFEGRLNSNPFIGDGNYCFLPSYLSHPSVQIIVPAMKTVNRTV